MTFKEWWSATPTWSLYDVCSVPDLLAEEAYRAGQEDMRDEAIAEARRMGEETLARNIGMIPMEDDDE